MDERPGDGAGSGSDHLGQLTVSLGLASWSGRRQEAGGRPGEDSCARNQVRFLALPGGGGLLQQSTETWGPSTPEIYPLSLEARAQGLVSGGQSP